MAEQINVIMTEYPDYGWGIESPQLPELIGGRDKREELESELSSILEFGGAPKEFSTSVHWQRYFTRNNTEMAVRVRQDEHAQDRMQVYDRINAALSNKEQIKSISRLPKRPTGEILFICSVAEDRLDDFRLQLDPNGDTFIVTVSVAESYLYTFPLSNESQDSEDRSKWITEGEGGWNENTTVGDIIKRQQISGKGVLLNF